MISASSINSKNFLKSEPMRRSQNFQSDAFCWITFTTSFCILHSRNAPFLFLLLSRAVGKRTRQLKEALLREKFLNQETKTAQERMMALQRAGVVGQVSGLLAHELNQPLGSLNLYARSLIRAADLQKLTNEKLIEVLDEIRKRRLRPAKLFNE